MPRLAEFTSIVRVILMKTKGVSAACEEASAVGASSRRSDLGGLPGLPCRIRIACVSRGMRRRGWEMAGRIARTNGPRLLAARGLDSLLNSLTPSIYKPCKCSSNSSGVFAAR